MTPSEKSQLIEYKLERAKGTLTEAVLLFNNKFYNAAVSRVYYACFYTVSALLAMENINVRNHSGVIQMFWAAFCVNRDDQQ